MVDFTSIKSLQTVRSIYDNHRCDLYILACKTDESDEVESYLKHLRKQYFNRKIVPVTEDQELTTQQAADLLSVSRSYLINLLKRGEIPYRTVGTHRRIQASDVIRYREQSVKTRSEALRELAQISQEISEDY